MLDQSESESEPNAEDGDKVRYNICTCDALTIVALKVLASKGINGNVMHTAILQKWKANEGKYPDDVNGNFTITAKTGDLGIVSIKSYEVTSFEPEFQHVLVVNKHHKFGNHCLYVKRKWTPTKGDYKNTQVYITDDDWQCKENKEYKIPVQYPGNMLYRVDITWTPFNRTDQIEEIERKPERNSSKRPGEKGDHNDAYEYHQLSTPDIPSKKRDTKGNLPLNSGPPSKKRYNKVLHGYIDGTTQCLRAKSGKTDYFRFDIVSKGECFNVVCYDKQRYQEIWNENNSDTIYKFTNLSFKDDSYMMETDTQWKKFEGYKYEKCLKTTEIVDTTTQTKIYKRVHITAILYNLHELKPTRKNVERKTAVLQDESGYIRCTIFGKMNVDLCENIPYRITYLWLTTYRGRRVLTTTDETEFVELDLKDNEFPLDIVLPQKRKDIGIQNRVGQIVSFSKEVMKSLCPDCKTDVSCDANFEGETASCDNEDCATTLLTVGSLLKLTYICFRFKYEECNKVEPLLECPSDLLDKLLGIAGGTNLNAPREYQTRLIGKQVDITFDVDDYEVIAIKFP